MSEHRWKPDPSKPLNKPAPPPDAVSSCGCGFPNWGRWVQSRGFTASVDELDYARCHDAFHIERRLREELNSEPLEWKPT